MEYIIIIVDITDIIAIMNTNTSRVKLLVMKFLLTNSVSNSSYIMPFFQIKNFFIMFYTGQCIL